MTKFLRAHTNSVGILAFAIVIAALGAVDVFRPFGLRFSDLTGRVVTMDTMIRIGILTIVVVGLNLLMGYAGQVSLGQAGFYALGAYASAILSTLASRHKLLIGVADQWWWPWLMIAVSMALTGGFAYLVGKPILRLKGNYLAMATLGLGIIIYILGGQFEEITGGYDGLTGVPRLQVGSFRLWPPERYYFLVWGAAIAVIVIATNIVNSRIGRALRAIHTGEHLRRRYRALQGAGIGRQRNVREPGREPVRPFSEHCLPQSLQLPHLCGVGGDGRRRRAVEHLGSALRRGSHLCHSRSIALKIRGHPPRPGR